MTIISFAPWEPDKAELNGGTTGDVQNVLCSTRSYLPFPGYVALTDALPDTPLGHFTARSLSGQVTIFAGTATGLYAVDNTDLSWTDVSGTTYNANETARWDFEQFGEYVVAVNINDDPQVFQLGVSSAFDDLGGSPPRASFVKAWGDFLCLMQHANNLNRAQWSGLNDITIWTPGVSNSDYQDFPEGGVVQGSSRATNPIIFMERAIYLGTFVPGSSVIFTFVKAHDGTGANSPYSIASRGEFTFFADVGGFYQITPDGAVVPMGFEKVDRTIFGKMAASDIANIQGAIDPFYSRVYWAADLTGAGSFNSIVIYDWVQQRWTLAAQNTKGIFPAATAGYTLEGLDAVSTNIDLLPFSLDSKVWQGGAPVIAAFGLDDRLGFFNGTPKQAVITTQETGDLAGSLTLVTSTYPVIDTDSATIAIGSRMKRSDVASWTSEIPLNSVTGRADKLSTARFHRFRVTIPSGEDWTHAQGIDVTSQPAGRR
jgi:hypothetical protein